MKVTSALGLVAFAAVAVRGELLQLYNGSSWKGCEKEYSDLTTLEKLLSPCGTAEVPCPVMAGEDSEDTDPDPKVKFECGTKVTLQATGGNVTSTTSIQGIVAGKGDFDYIPKESFWLGASAMKALCPFPCPSPGDANKTVCNPTPDCPDDGGTKVELRLPVIAPLSGNMVPLSYLTTLSNGVEVKYKFTTGTSTPPPDGTPDGTALTLPILARPVEIVEGAKLDCNYGDETLYTEAEAIEKGGCGGSTNPCPISQDIFGNVCFDPTSDKPCIEVTFWRDGVTDETSKYCKKDKVCPRLGEIKKIFRVTMKAQNSPVKNEVSIPIGAWNDICPYECTFDIGYNAVTSRTCATDASATCQAVFEGNDPITAPTNWKPYKVPVAKAEVQVLKSEPVACTVPAPVTTTTPRPTGPPTVPTNVTTTPKPNGAARQAAVGGGLTALLLACSLVYM